MIQLRPHQERIVTSMVTTSKGQVIVPTGGGKTLCMIKDAQRLFNSCSWDVFLKKPERKTIVVVSPRILLAQQHSDEFEEWMGLHPMLQRQILHVHSGDTHHYSTTNPDANAERGSDVEQHYTRVGRFLSTEDADGYAKVYIDIA